ncbi:MarR family winged helix-turn-helix transcriptional regulator [Streptomyces sp. NPDC048521]|uniref:MarR family winged helix-turn-helix transcriptional regulator n=1 Tax=Streptomyces sp. NPDC048521 TaxID=3365566 RepID=UPI00371DF0C4
MAAFRARPPSDEAPRVTADAAELLEVLSGRAPTTPASQVRVLLVLEQHDGINLRTLADSLGTTPPSASRLCDRLETTGFLERRPGAADRREVRLRLSGSGRSFLADLRARGEGEVRAVLAAMPSAKREALLEGLETFCAAAAPRILAHDAGPGAVLSPRPGTPEDPDTRGGRTA